MLLYILLRIHVSFVVLDLVFLYLAGKNVSEMTCFGQTHLLIQKLNIILEYR